MGWVCRRIVIGHVTLAAITYTITWYPIVKTSHCKSLEDRAHVDEIYGALYTDQYLWLCLRQDGRHFKDDIFKCIFLNENV